MKIIKLQAENFKKLKAIEIIPQGSIVEITGKCEQGKTTVLDAISSALCGTKWEEPVRQGEDKGKIIIDLGDKIVTRTYTKAGGGTLKVESKDGAKYPSPQALLDKLVGKIAFDPLAFAKADSKKQVEMLLNVVEIKVDPARLKELSGVIVPETPNPLDMLNTAYKAVYDERTAVNRQADAAVKTLASLPVVAEVKPVSLAELVKERDGLEAINRKNKEAWNGVSSSLECLKKIEGKRDILCDEIADLEQQLVAKRDQLKTATEYCMSANNEYEKVKKAAALLQDVSLDDINTRISQADAVNLQAKQFTDRAQRQTEADKFTKDANDLTAKLKSIVDYKTEIIQKTKFPVPGLDFAGGGVIFDGKPFSQASTAQKIRVGIAVAMAGNPELRVIMIDGYESMDADQRAIVEQMAQEHDFQVWCAAVSDAGVGVYIEDGEIK